MSTSSDPAVQDVVRQWVLAAPGTCAVHDPRTGESLTYEQLWERTGWTAAVLAERGVRRGDVVAVGLDRSVGLIVALLGILRAGAGYLPLDGQAPRDRSTGIVREAEAAVVLWSGVDTERGRLPGDAVPVALPEARPAAGAAPPEVPVGGADTAYVMYTSGSTGRPKGVVVPHRAVLRLAEEPLFCTVEPRDRVALTSNPAFDATTFEIWNTLTAGGTVVVMPSPVEVTIEEWAASIRREEITTVFLTTSLFHTLAREAPGSFRSLRNLVIGGEQLDITAVRRVLAAGPPGRLVNGYGPTEATTFSAYYDCTEESLAGLDRIPIGYPLQRTTLHILDDRGAPVAPGETGELCIGGPGVATGYLKRPQLTAERFVSVPGGERVYRTGDLARQLPGGAFEVLGRRDRQVKLRGFRIELEEIESAAAATGLTDAVFVEKIGDGPTATLVGFVLPSRAANDPTGIGTALSRQLERRLPRYMVPSRWVVIDRVPLGPTGKADRAGLMALLAQPPATRRAAEPSRRPVDEALARLWAEMLELPEVAGTDNFVESGGNSIMAIQLASRIEHQLGVRLDPADILLADSLDGLAAQIRHGRPTRPTDATAP